MASAYAKADEVALALIKPPDVKPSAIEPLAIRPLDIRPLDVDEGMRTISAIPIYAAIEEKYPGEYAKMEEILQRLESQAGRHNELRGLYCLLQTPCRCYVRRKAEAASLCCPNHCIAQSLKS